MMTNDGLELPEHQLKPCPFCGGVPVVKFVGNRHTKKRSVVITCGTFGCTYHLVVAAIRGTAAWCYGKAAEQWNRRFEP